MQLSLEVSIQISTSRYPNTCRMTHDIASHHMISHHFTSHHMRLYRTFRIRSAFTTRCSRNCLRVGTDTRPFVRANAKQNATKNGSSMTRCDSAFMVNAIVAVSNNSPVSACVKNESKIDLDFVVVVVVVVVVDDRGDEDPDEKIEMSSWSVLRFLFCAAVMFVRCSMCLFHMCFCTLFALLPVALRNSCLHSLQNSESVVLTMRSSS